jgi:octopine/nopaline transport system substrate-binding protein
VAKDSPLAKLKTLAEVEKALDGKSVGVVTGTTYAKFVQKKIPSADLKTYDATTQQLADLASGRIDAAYSDSPTVMDFLATPDGANFAKVEVKVMAMDDPATLGKGMGVGMKKGNTELKTKVDAALCKMVNDGKVKEASMIWFQDDYTIPCKK